MGDFGHQLIAILRTDARISVLAFAKKLRVSRGTIQNRIDKLEQSGVIVGYTVKFKPETEQHKIRAIMSIALIGNCSNEVQTALRGLPCIHTLHTTNDHWDLIAELRAEI